MNTRYYRPPSPRRIANPARSSTGSFADPYHDPYYTSPRSSAERVAGHPHGHSTVTYAPSSATSSRSSRAKYDAYSGQPRSNTHNEHDDHAVRGSTASLQPMSIPIRTHGSHHHESSSSPLVRSWDNRADTFVTYVPPKRDHKRIYSVDDNNSTRLIAEVDPHTYESGKGRYGSTAARSGRQYYSSKPLVRTTDLNDDDYSYTDPASMYRDTEPVWRRPRAGSVERGSRPTSMIVEKGPRTSIRDLGPPPTTRGLDKLNSGIVRNSSLREPSKASSWDRSGETGKYREEPYSGHSRSAKHPTTAVHQEPRDHRREAHHDDYERRDRETDGKRHSGSDRFEDREIASRGFGIRTGEDKYSRDESLDRQPIWPAHEPSRPRAEDYNGGYYPSEDPRRAPETRMPDPRISQELDNVRYDDRLRERERDRRERDVDDHSYAPAAVPVAGAVAAYAVTGASKSRDRDRDSDKDREVDRKAKSERYDDEERRRRHHRQYSSDDSNDERPRRYVDHDAARDDSARKPDPALDPDEEYRRRILQEKERSRRGTRDRDHSDSDRERDHRRREDRDRAREDSDTDRRSRTSPNSTAAEPALSRYGDRPSHVLDTNFVQEPDSLASATEGPSRSMQIVTAPKEPPQQPKGILRKPTEKFPEDPEPIREGVAPHKSALKGKDIPPDARWTKIDRRLVNPEALEEAKERFEERMDCVIVLRVLTKQEIQKLADRTREIREAREEEYERRERRDRRSHRSRRDGEDRDHNLDYDSEAEELERERNRERPRMIESGR